MAGDPSAGEKDTKQDRASQAQGPSGVSSQHPPATKPSPWKSVAKPPSSPWGKSNATPPEAGGSAGFPSLSAASSQPKRHRHSPWHQTTKINPYPPRSHEIAHRWLARDAPDSDLSLSTASSSSSSGSSTPGASAGPSTPRRTGIFSLRDFDNPPNLQVGLGGAEEEAAAEDADFYRGPVQMYGMSRVTVRDLSDPSLKGKNKVKRQDISENGPQIYGRHYQPHVQRGKRPLAVRPELPHTSDAPLDESEADHFGLQEVEWSLPPVEQENLVTAPLSEVVAVAMRQQRSQAAQARLNGQAETKPSDTTDAFAPLYAKISADLSSSASISRADWLDQNSANTMELFASLPVEVEEAIHAIIQQGVLRFAAWQRNNEASSLSVCSLVRLLVFSAVMDYHLNAHDVFSSVLRTLEVTLSSNQPAVHEALRSLPTSSLHSIIEATVVHADLLLEQHRFAAADTYSRRVWTACNVLKELRILIKQSGAHESSLFYLSDLVQSFHADLIESGQLADRSYRFLLPLPVKLRLLKHCNTEMKEEARKQNLWASFYAPGSSSSQTHSSGDQEDSSTVTLRLDRSNLLTSTIDQLSSLKSWQYQQDLRVSFVGDGEEGVDSIFGGVRKEWFTLVLKDLYSKGSLQQAKDAPEFSTISPGADVDLIRCLGVILGWSILHGIPLGLSLPDYITARCLQCDHRQSSTSGEVEVNLDALAQYEPRLVASLHKMRSWCPPEGSDSKSQQVAAFEQTFSLNFVATISSAAGQIKTVPLCPGGQHRHVNSSNLDEYIHLLTRYLLFDSISEHLDALQEGFSRVFPLESPARTLLMSYAPDELRAMIHGDPEPMRVVDIRGRVDVLGTRSQPSLKKEDDTLLQWFWAVVPHLQIGKQAPPNPVESLFPRELLSYITSSTHLSITSSSDEAQRPTAPPPPPFRIHLVSLPPYVSELDVAPLPWTSTCTATLFLPRDVYRDQDHLKERLECALRLSDGGGFGLK